MKTKFKYFSLAIATLLMVGFASCSSDDDTTQSGNEKETISVFLKIASTPVSRAEVPALTSDQVAFNNGHLYFTTGEGAIVRHYKLVADKPLVEEKLPDLPAGELYISSLAGGKEILNLPGNTKHVYVFGNTPTGISLADKGPIKTVKANVLTVQTQGKIGDVNLYGEAFTLTPVTTTEGNQKYTVQVDLAPTVARIELSELECSEQLESFKLKGVFMDNFYKDANVDGTVGTLVDNGKEAASYAHNTGSYLSANPKGVLHDWYGDALMGSDSKVVVAPSSGVWGYNLFAQTVANSGSAVPRIIIRLADVKASTESGITFSEDQFITVKGFKNADGTTDVPTISSGNIYKLKRIVFCSKHLASAPNLGFIDVTVTIAPITWKVVHITPDF